MWSRIFIALVLLLVAAPAAAAGTGGFSQSELAQLAPLLVKNDTVGLSEFDKTGKPVSMTLATRIRAKRDTVFQLFTDPENFYYISTLFKENTILDRTENAIVWTWASRHKFFSIVGRNRIVLYPPHRADVTVEESSMGRGRFTLRFVEDGDSTILVINGFLNVHSSEWLIRFIVGNSPSMIQATNIAIGLVVLKGTRALAEREQKGKPKRRHVTGGTAGGEPTLLSKEDIDRLKPLLMRGQVFLCNSHKGGRLKQAIVVDRVRARADAFSAAAAVPQNYNKHISAITDVTVHGSRDAQVDFSWTLGFSIFGITSRNQLGPVPEGIMLRAVDGDMKGAAWRWQVVPESSATSIVAYHAFADPARTGAILEATVIREPYLEHGLVMGSNIVMMKAMRRVVETDPRR